MTELTRRTMLGGVAAGITATAGCLDVLTGEEPLEFSAEPATVPDSALEETGYELVQTESPTISQEFTVAGQTRTVEVTNQVATYDKSVSLGPLGSVQAALFAVLSTPQVEIAGRTFNPIDEMSNRQLLKQIASQYDGLSVGENVDSEEIEQLGKTTTVEKYEATATVEDREVPIYLLLTRLQHGDDFVVTVGGYPQQLSGEESKQYTLMQTVEH